MLRGMTPERIREVVSQFALGAKQVYGSSLQEIILYGSCARGDFSADSDIDLLVLLDVPQDRINQERKKIISISDRLDMDYDVVLAPVFQSKQVFDRYLPASAFFQNVITEGIRYA